MKKTVTPILIVFMIVSSLSAQDIHFSQFWASPLTLGPAQAGNFDGTYRAGIIYRNQWAGFSPYNTFSASYDMTFPVGLFPGDAVSAGLSMYNDKAGDADYSTMYVMLSGAYHKALGANNRVTLGVQAGYAQKKLDKTKLIFADQFNGIDFTNPTGELLSQTSFGNLDINAGLQFSSLLSNNVSIELGATVMHLVPPAETFLTNTNNTLGMRIVGYGSGNIKLSDQLMLAPRFIYQTQTKAQEISVGADLGYKLPNESFNATVFAGSWYRFNDALIPYVGMEYKNFKMGLSYDVNISSLNDASNGKGGFEISLIYIGRITIAPPTIIVPCIRF